MSDMRVLNGQTIVIEGKTELGPIRIEINEQVRLYEVRDMVGRINRLGMSRSLRGKVIDGLSPGQLVEIAGKRLRFPPLQTNLIIQRDGKFESNGYYRFPDEYQVVADETPAAQPTE